MKQLFMMMACIAMIGPLIAQIEDTPIRQNKRAANPTNKGTSFVGFDARSFSVGRGRESLVYNMSYDLSFGNFVADRLAIGGSIKHDLVHAIRGGNIVGNNDNVISNRIAISSFARYYLMKKNGLFVEGNFEIGYNTRSINNVQNFTRLDDNIGLGVGYTFFLGKNKRWALEPKYTQYVSTPFSNPRSFSTYGSLSFGVKHFFGGGRKKTKETMY